MESQRKLWCSLPEPKITVNPMLNSRERDSYGGYESLGVIIEWSQCSATYNGTELTD